MSAKINDGGPAFPVNAEIYNGTGLCGMTLRDWFAGQALTRLAFEHKPNAAASWAYQYADAMIAAREVKP